LDPDYCRGSKVFQMNSDPKATKKMVLLDNHFFLKFNSLCIFMTYHSNIVHIIKKTNYCFDYTKVNLQFKLVHFFNIVLMSLSFVKLKFIF